MEVGKDYALALHELVTALQFSGTPLAVQGNNFVLTNSTIKPCEWPGTMQTLLGCLLRIVEKMSVLQKTMLSQLCVYMLSVDVAFDEGLPARQLKLQTILQSASEAFPHDAPLCIQPLRFLQRVRKEPMEVPLRPVAAPDPKAAKWESIAWMSDNSLRPLGKGHWPAYSPDLSPIENIWALMERMVSDMILPGTDNHSEARRKAELQKNVWKAWNSISQETINEYVASAEGRFQECLGLMGGATNH